MNKRAMDDYDSLEFESARRTLHGRGAACCAPTGSTRRRWRRRPTPTSASSTSTGSRIGTAGSSSSSTRSRSTRGYKLDPAVATPELDEAFQAAQKQAASWAAAQAARRREAAGREAAGAGRSRPRRRRRRRPRTCTAWCTRPSTRSRPNTPIPVRAKLGSDVGATRVFLFFRGSGQEDFVSVPMKNTSGVEWVGVIPPEAVQRQVAAVLPRGARRARPRGGRTPGRRRARSSSSSARRRRRRRTCPRSTSRIRS